MLFERLDYFCGRQDTYNYLPRKEPYTHRRARRFYSERAAERLLTDEFCCGGCCGFGQLSIGKHNSVGLTALVTAVTYFTGALEMLSETSSRAARGK